MWIRRKWLPMLPDDVLAFFSERFSAVEITEGWKVFPVMLVCKCGYLGLCANFINVKKNCSLTFMFSHSGENWEGIFLYVASDWQYFITRLFPQIVERILPAVKEGRHLVYPLDHVEFNDLDRMIIEMLMQLFVESL